jgi:hypothetical protein
MSTHDWKSAEAIAFFEKEWDHAIMQAKVALAYACEDGGVLEKMQKLPHALNGALRDHLGDESYRALEDLVFARRFVREFLDAGETGKL